MTIIEFYDVTIRSLARFPMLWHGLALIVRCAPANIQSVTIACRCRCLIPKTIIGHGQKRQPVTEPITAY